MSDAVYKRTNLGKLFLRVYVLPAFWASTLINNDLTGISHDDLNVIREWIKSHPELADCVSCGDNSFYTHWHDAPLGYCECLNFYFPVLINAKG